MNSEGNKMTDTRRDFIQGLREVADFYEQHPEVKLCSCTELMIYGANKEEIAVGARAFGKAEKEYSDDHFSLTKTFSGGVRLQFFAARERICERIVTGKKVIPTQIIPAQEEQVIPEHTVDIVEWDCSPILAASPDEVLTHA